MKASGFDVREYNDPLEALSNSRSNFYDLLLVDINMPRMNGFELCTEILKIDVNIRVCFITVGESNIESESLSELYSTLNVGCYIRKPVTLDQLVR